MSRKGKGIKGSKVVKFETYQMRSIKGRLSVCLCVCVKWGEREGEAE